MNPITAFGSPELAIPDAIFKRRREAIYSENMPLIIARAIQCRLSLTKNVETRDSNDMHAARCPCEQHGVKIY